MLTVRTFVASSTIHGLGLFAGEDIPKGTLVWKFDPRFNLYFDPEEVETMHQVQREFIETYAFLSLETGKYVYTTDDNRFVNHSSNNNVYCVPSHSPEEPEGRCFAKRNIKKGEEILEDYRTFDTNDAVSDSDYLNP